MRWPTLPCAVLVLAACRSAEMPEDTTEWAEVRVHLVRPNWGAAREALRRAVLESPKNPEPALMLADVERDAFADLQSARVIYGRWLGTPARARALHGLGRCAWAEADRERATEMFEESLAQKETPACARDAALLYLSLGDQAAADKHLELAAKISAQAMRTELLLAAAGKFAMTGPLPTGWDYALDRARVEAAQGDDSNAATHLALHVERACANDAARKIARRLAAEDFFLKGLTENPPR
ncbi:MAG: hypothetical protein V3T86_12385 [Planctomycetota bacterium]